MVKFFIHILVFALLGICPLSANSAFAGVDPVKKTVKKNKTNKTPASRKVSSPRGKKSDLSVIPENKAPKKGSVTFKPAEITRIPAPPSFVDKNGDKKMQSPGSATNKAKPKLASMRNALIEKELLFNEEFQATILETSVPLDVPVVMLPASPDYKHNFKTLSVLKYQLVDLLKLSPSKAEYIQVADAENIPPSLFFFDASILKTPEFYKWVNNYKEKVSFIRNHEDAKNSVVLADYQINADVFYKYSQLLSSKMIQDLKAPRGVSVQQIENQ